MNSILSDFIMDIHSENPCDTGRMTGKPGTMCWLFSPCQINSEGLLKDAHLGSFIIGSITQPALEPKYLRTVEIVLPGWGGWLAGSTRKAAPKQAWAQGTAPCSLCWVPEGGNHSGSKAWEDIRGSGFSQRPLFGTELTPGPNWLYYTEPILFSAPYI